MAEFVAAPDGVPIAFERRGAGEALLVFVHGWSCDRSYWNAQMEPFSREFQVVAVDLAGHGESGVQRAAWTIAAFGADVAAVVERLGPARSVLIGHSMGGDVILEAARRLGSRVAGLVWVDAYNRLGTPRTPEQVEATLAPFRAAFVETTRPFVRGMFPPGLEDPLVERVVADMSSAPPAIALGALEAAITYDREVPAVLRELEMPLIAINPDNRPTDIESMVRHGIEVLIMPGVGHFPMMEDPQRFNRLLRKAIQRLLG